MKNGGGIERADGMLWVPVRVKAKREKKLAEYCEANLINYYLPLKRSLKRYEKRTFEFLLPMFSGYVFCHLCEPDRKKILKSKAVFYLVDVDDLAEKKLIEELCDIQKIESLALAGDATICPELASGKKVKIRGGPLKGVSGRVENRNGQLLVSVNVEMLGQSISVMLDIGDVELEEK